MKRTSTPPITALTTKDRAIILFAVDFASSSFPAPRSWPARIEMDSPMAKRNTLKRFAMVFVMFIAATTASPRREKLWFSMVSPRDQRVSFAARGIPLMTIFFTRETGTLNEAKAPSMNLHFSLWVWVQTISIPDSTKRETTVAIAAPLTPSSGNPNLPKINR